MFYIKSLFLIIFESSKKILDDISLIYDIDDFHPNVGFKLNSKLKLLMLINFKMGSVFVKIRYVVLI